jgi:hypothetical protein
MTMNDAQISQEAFSMIRELAALCATPGIQEATQNIANESIKKLLNGQIANSVTKLNAKASGLVI